MPTLRLPQFSTPEVLKSIDRTRLVEFLDPYRGFLRERGFELPPRDSGEELDHERLVQVFMSPDERTPAELIDALYYVDGMATSRGMEGLLDAAAENGLQLDSVEEVTPADLAVQVWLRNPDLLERKQAEQFLLNPKSFEHYRTDDPEAGRLELPPPEIIQNLETTLNDWFEKKKRGRTARVFCFPRADSIWFMVRHGEPFKREASVVGVEPSSVAYRPLKYDVIVYTPSVKELRINAQLKGERRLYRMEFGRYLFGGQNYFLEQTKYTLEPLREDLGSSLVCADVEGMEWVRLKELHYSWGGPYGEYEIVKANDLVAAMRERGQSMPETPALVKAAFLVKFASAKRPRTVTIKLPNTAMFSRDDDAELVEEWLRSRGFLNGAETVETAEPVLAFA